MEEYISLIIDIERSKKYGVRERNEIQRSMLMYSKFLNELFAKSIKYAVAFSAGDELQGLFLDVTTAVMYFRLLEILVNPVKIRAGVGVGEWTVKIEGGVSMQQDGPVYHRARRAITEVHAMKLHNIRICSEREDVLSNSLINASNVLKQQQNINQNYVLTILELLYPFSRRQLGISGEKILEELLVAKCGYILQLYGGISNKAVRGLNLGSLPFVWANIQSVHIIPINGYLTDSERMVRQKNRALEVAEILECTRQNAASIIKSGNADKIRELDLTALQYLENRYGG